MPITNIQEVEQSLGIEAGKLTEMIGSEEDHTVDISGLVIKSKDDHDTLIANVKKEAGVAAVEIAIKNARKDLGLEFEGKTMENLLKAHATKVETDAKIEPDKKVESLKGDLEKLRGISAEWEGKYNSLQESIKIEKQKSTIDQMLMKEMPDNMVMDKRDMLAILHSRNNFNIGEDGFEAIDPTTGKVLKNESTLSPKTAKEFISEFTKPYLKPVDGGRGGQNTTGAAAPGSLEAFEKEMADKGITGEAFNNELSARIKKGSLKID